jgi:hypothetical protein
MVVDLVEQVFDGRSESLREVTQKDALVLREGRRKIRACLYFLEALSRRSLPDDVVWKLLSSCDNGLAGWCLVDVLLTPCRKPVDVYCCLSSPSGD